MDASAIERYLTEQVREAGLRMTMARRAICRILAESEAEFLTASSILERAEIRASQIDPSTVYRTLDEFERIGLVHHVHLGAGQAGTWHLTLDRDHQHLVCERCGRTIEVPVRQLEIAFADLTSKYGFRPNAHHFTILGFCSECDRLETSAGGEEIA